MLHKQLKELNQTKLWCNIKVDQFIAYVDRYKYESLRLLEQK